MSSGFADAAQTPSSRSDAPEGQASNMLDDILPLSQLSVIDLVESVDLVQDDVSYEDILTYKARRWLWNESEQLRRRYVKFDIPALLRACERAVGPGARCSSITKLPEGTFNKTILVTMHDGVEVIARIPNPHAGHPHYTTASEVATMDYLKNKLQIPVPKVLTYSAYFKETDVGAEYIIMEKCPGIELGRVWDRLTGAQRIAVVEQLAGIQLQMYQAKFQHYGALFYIKDVPDVRVTEIDNTFCIGPTTSRSWFDSNRGDLNIDRGPWKTAEEVMTAIGKRELACLETFERFPRSHQQGIFNGPEGFRPTRAFKESVLHDYFKILKHIIPKEDAYKASIFWHHDLHQDNIFVNEANPTEITGIIDWQGVHLSPAFLQVQHPTLIRFDGPVWRDFSKAPKLPSNYSELPPEEKEAVRRLHNAQCIFAIYEIALNTKEPALLQTFRYQDVLAGGILNMIGNTFNDGEPFMQSLLDTAARPEIWAQIIEQKYGSNAKVECPLKYSESDFIAHQSEFLKWEKDIILKEKVLDIMGADSGWDGQCLPGEYKTLSLRLAQAKDDFLNAYANTDNEREQWMKVWPFQDDAVEETCLPDTKSTLSRTVSKMSAIWSRWMK